MKLNRCLPVGLALAFGGGQALAVSSPQLDVPYVPTPEPVVEAMLELAEVGEDDLVYDLGSGDGRIVITAASRHGARGVGVDLDPVRVEEARDNARAAGVADRVEFIQGDLFEIDFSDATVLTLYLFPEVNLQLRELILTTLEPGTRVVSHAFDMGDWMPDQVVEVDHSNIFFWVVPAEVAGTWEWETPGGDHYRLELHQDFQLVSGTLAVNGQPGPVYDAQLQGAQLRFSYQHPAAGEQQVEVRFDGGRLIGENTLGEEPVAAERVEWVAEPGDQALWLPNG